MKCFFCVVELLNMQLHGEGLPVVTQYKGTPVCATHAKQLYNENYQNLDATKREELHEVKTA